MDKQDEINEMIYRMLNDIFCKVFDEDSFLLLKEMIKEEQQRKEVPLYRG